MWPAIAGFIAEGFKTWVASRGVIKQAELQKKLADIQADVKHDEGVGAGWKDEYLTILLTSPILVTFWGAFFNQPHLIENARVGIDAVGSMPEWYQVILGTIVLGSFSIRGFQTWKRYKLKDKRVDAELGGAEE